jgi:hypothetical protein
MRGFESYTKKWRFYLVDLILLARISAAGASQNGCDGRWLCLFAGSNIIHNSFAHS